MSPYKDPEKRRATLKKAKRKYREKKKRQRRLLWTSQESEMQRRLITAFGYSAEQLLIKMELMVNTDAQPVYIRIVQFGKFKQFLVSDDPNISVNEFLSDLYDSWKERGILSDKVSFDDLFWNMTYDPRTYEVRCVEVEE